MKNAATSTKGAKNASFWTWSENVTDRMMKSTRRPVSVVVTREIIMVTARAYDKTRVRGLGRRTMAQERRKENPRTESRRWSKRDALLAPWRWTKA